MEYIRGSGAPECIFHNQHKTLYNLSIHVVFYCISLGVCYLFFSHGCVQMGQMDYISSILFKICKVIWEIFHWSHVTYVYADQSQLFVLSKMIDRLRSAYVSMCRLIMMFFIKKHIGASSVFSDQASMYSQFSFFCSYTFFRETAKIWSLHHFVSISHLVFFWGSKNKNKFGKIDIFRVQLPLIKLWEVIVIVSYVSYTTCLYNLVPNLIKMLSNKKDQHITYILTRPCMILFFAVSKCLNSIWIMLWMKQS